MESSSTFLCNTACTSHHIILWPWSGPCHN
jgi:hypothetical protein